MKCIAKPLIVEVHPYDGMTPPPGTVKKDFKDHLDYTERRLGIMTPKGFVPFAKDACGEVLVTHASGRMRILTEAEFAEEFEEVEETVAKGKGKKR